MITFDHGLLDDLVESGIWYESDSAATLLECSSDQLERLARRGDLDMIRIGGRTLIRKPDSSAIRPAALDVQAADLPDLSGHLSTYLFRHPATGDLDQAREEGRPLVSSRRGPANRYRRFALRFHTVALPTAGFARWLIATQSENGAPSTPVPTVRRLAEQLAELPGASRATWITDLAGKRARVRDWVRLYDPERWGVVLDPAWRPQVYGEALAVAELHGVAAGPTPGPLPVLADPADLGEVDDPADPADLAEEMTAIFGGTDV